MTADQIVLTSSILVLLGFFIWGKYRYDAISVAALVFLVAISAIVSAQNILVNSPLMNELRATL